MLIAGTMQETNQYTFQMPNPSGSDSKVVFAQSQQPPQAFGEAHKDRWN